MVEDPHRDLLGLLADRGIPDGYSPEVMAEVNALRADSGIDDPTLEDRTAVPFVTVDGPGTRDLDQALHVASRGSGYCVQYAIADAAWFVRPGTALFADALARGASYYMPGRSVPMLPRALSEDLVSLGPLQDRRAMVFEMDLDADGVCTSTEIVQARIRSRHQLTFDHVDALVSGRSDHPVRDPEVVDSLRHLRTVGKLRARDAAARGVVAYNRREVRVRLTPGQDAGLTAVEVARTPIEGDNAQLSLLCNAEGARLLRDYVGKGAESEPIYKVHPPPQEDSLRALAERIDACVKARHLDERWRWRRDETTLADYLSGLPDDAQHARLAAALRRQSIMVNVRSAFAKQPGPHHGVGAEVYGRFSAPMREVVGVFLHKEMWEALGVTANDAERDTALRVQVIAAANRARSLQRDLSSAADRLVIDDLFAGDLAMPAAERPARVGTVMGLRRGRVYVRLDDPPLDVKVYVDRTDRDYTCDEAGASLWRGVTRVCGLGDAVAVRVVGQIDNGRWILDFAD